MSRSFFDTHTHLGDEQFAADRQDVLERARAAGVDRVVEIADAPAQWPTAIALSRARPAQVRCSLGLHPYYADQLSDALLAELKRRIRLPEVVAVGEIGLDYVKARVGAAVQRASFERLLAACRDWRKPAVIHCRGAYADLRAILAKTLRSPPAGERFWGVIHCFSGTAEDAAFCRDLGLALGVDGPVTYPKNKALREALARVGAGCLVLETDSPYLPPQSSRGRRNEPAAVPEIAGALANALGLSVEDLASRTTANAQALYRITNRAP